MGFRKNDERNSKLIKNLTRLRGTIPEDLSTFMITFRRIMPRMRNISAKRYKQKTHTSCSTIPPPQKKNRAVYEITWKNMEEPDRPKMRNDTAQKQASSMSGN